VRFGPGRTVLPAIRAATPGHTGTITAETEVSRLFLPLVIGAVALLPVSQASQAVGGAGVQIDGPALITQKIRPGDGSERDPAFARVRQAILNAARRKDLDAVVRYFAPQTRCYTAVGLVFEEGGMTAAACAAQLRADPGEARDFLESLQRALEMGTAFYQGYAPPADRPGDWDWIVAPYVAVAGDIILSLPEIPGRYWIVAADGVRARSAPSSRAPVVEVLSYDIVASVTADDSTRVTESDACDAWVEVVTPTKRQAWICWKYLASPLEDMTFFFQRQPDGEWRLTGVYEAD